MPFIPAGRRDRVYSIYNFRHARPQLQQITYVDPGEPFAQRLTMYTGEIAVGHGSGTHAVELLFEYPVLGFFNNPIGGVSVGILPINDIETNQFRSSIAVVALTDFNTKDDSAFIGERSIAADLYEVNLDGYGKINAVVLSGSIYTSESDMWLLSYKVSVLERMTMHPPFRDPVLIGLGGWNGKYILDGFSAVGPLIRNGIPQS